MVIYPVVASVIQITLIPAVPTIAQFAASVATKCVAFGIPCAVGARLSSADRIGALATLRGGDNSNLVDLDRVDLRLGSLEEYCVIASIILGAVVDIYGDTPKEKEDATQIEQIAQSVHGICVCVGFLAAVYTTVVFALFGLYAKTALGTGDDQGYLKLLEATSTIRFRGFQSFLLCLLSFNTSFIMNMFLNHRGKTRWIIVGLSVVGTVISMSHFRFIVNTASQIIFR